MLYFHSITDHTNVNEIKHPKAPQIDDIPLVYKRVTREQ